MKKHTLIFVSRRIEREFAHALHGEGEDGILDYYECPVCGKKYYDDERLMKCDKCNTAFFPNRLKKINTSIDGV